MKEHTYRPNASAKKLYTTVSYVAFYQLKQPQHILMQRETNLHIWWECVCYIWWKYNTWISCVRESHWLTSTAAAPWTSTIHTQRSHHHYPQAPVSDRVTQWGGLSYRIWEFSGSLLWTVSASRAWHKVALLNRFHSPAPEEWIHFLALIGHIG